MDEQKSPLRIYCESCGAPLGFDIMNQTYRCTHCGRLTKPKDARDAVYRQRELDKNDNTESGAEQSSETYFCPTCGAELMFSSDDAAETCDFCGSSLVRREFSDDAQLPDVIIPFFITPAEARERMLSWGRANEKTPEGKSVVEHIDSLCGYYLPYKLARGPVEADVKRHGGERAYYCRGFLEGTAVNTSKQLDNRVLNDMEPFDWTAARPFEYGYVAGCGVKLSDTSGAETDRRVAEEVGRDFLPEVERVMQTSGVNVDVKTGGLMTQNVLLPVYFIREGKLLAAMNGQTGRIAVSTKREGKSFPWIIEPIIYTAVIILILGLWSNFLPELMIYGGLAIALIIFTAMGAGRGPLVRLITLQTKAGRAKREGGELIIDDEHDILKNPYDNTPVFCEPDEKGRPVPVKLRFYTVGRWLTILINALVTVFLPVMIAAVLRLLTMGEGERFLDSFSPGYGAAWYTIAAVVVLVYLIKGVRQDVYDHPYIYKIMPDGKKKLTGSRRDRRVTVLSMFGFGKKTSDGKRVTLLWLLKSFKGRAVAIFLVFLALLIGSAAAIVF
ncbi:MAG: zinc ribbon domain-containing protein [Clostridia bacterium]|nr:zinc ribbon domain-containing protein [Clostridia bacterium]